MAGYGVFDGINNRRLRRQVSRDYGYKDVTQEEVAESLPEGAPKPIDSAGGF